MLNPVTATPDIVVDSDKPIIDFSKSNRIDPPELGAHTFELFVPSPTGEDISIIVKFQSAKDKDLYIAGLIANGFPFKELSTGNKAKDKVLLQLSKSIKAGIVPPLPDDRVQIFGARTSQ